MKSQAQITRLTNNVTEGRVNHNSFPKEILFQYFNDKFNESSILVNLLIQNGMKITITNMARMIDLKLFNAVAKFIEENSIDYSEPYFSGEIITQKIIATENNELIENMFNNSELVALNSSAYQEGGIPLVGADE